MAKILIIDGNHLAHRAYHSMSRMSFKGKGTGAIFGFLNIMGGNLSKFKPKKVFICWDDGRNKHRLKLLPNYKNRTEQNLNFDGDDFHRQKRELMKICKCLGIPQLFYPGREADDFIYSLVKKYSKNPKNRIVIASGDKDFRQLVTDKILINDDNKGLITPLNFKKLFNIQPYQYSDYLCLIGDSSDKIPGVRGFGEKTALKLLSEYDTIIKYIACGRIDKNFVDTVGKVSEAFAINNKLINLKVFDDLYGPFKLRFIDNDKKPKVNRTRFMKLLTKAGINKWANDRYINQVP